MITDSNANNIYDVIRVTHSKFPHPFSIQEQIFVSSEELVVFLLSVEPLDLCMANGLTLGLQFILYGNVVQLSSLN